MWVSLLFLLPLVTADYFKETQDFKYSRSDGKGEQKGFYGAQTGNMGGNYEVAHNMDNLAENQMKNLMHQVGGQLGIDPTAIGTGHTPVAMGSGSLYGSASASGKSVQKGLQTDFDTYGGAHNSRLGSSYSSTHGAAAGGASRSSQQFSNYDGYGANTQDNLRQQTLGVQSVNDNAQHSAAHYGSGGRHLESSVNNYETSGREHGERYGSSTTNFQSGSQYGQQAGLHSVAAETQHAAAGSHAIGGSQHAIGGSQHSTAGSQHATAGSQHATTNQHGYQKSFSTYGVAESQNAGTVIHPVPLGGAVKLIVRPGQTIRTTIPIRVPVQPSETNKLQSGYVQSSTFGSGDSHRQNIHSDSQVYGGRNVDVSQGSQVVGVGVGNEHDRTNGAKGYESSYSYSKEWEKHGASATQPRQVQYISVPSVRPINSETTDNIETSGSHDSSRTSYGTNYHSGRQNVGQSRDKLTNTYVNLGKNVEDSQYGSRQGSANANQYQSSYSTQNEWENQHKGEAWNANSNLARSNDRLSTTHVGATDSEGMGAHNIGSTLKVGGRPKSYQSSYSYSKSWESHGTPRTTVGGGNLESQRHGATYTIPYSEHVGSAESLYGSNGQQNMRYNSGSSSSGQNHMSSSHSSRAGETASTDMDRLEKQLKSKMNEMCPTCGEAKTKGYSASYSYSAQRGYGGSQAGHENLRRKRRVDNRKGELDEYENISIQNKIADYKNWEEQVKDLRMRVKNMIHKLSNDDKKVETLPTKTPSDSMGSYRSKNRSNIDRDVELIENDDVQNEIKDINDLKNKVSDLRKKVQTLLRVQEEDNNLKREIEVLNKKIGDFESHMNHPKKDINNKRRNIRDVNFEQETEYLGQQTEDLGQQTEDLGKLVDLGQQSEDLKQGDFYLGQQTEDFGQSSLQFGQETQNYKETSYAGQQTQHSGQQTEHLGQSTLQFGSEAQNYRATSYGGQQNQNYKETGYAGQQTQHLGQQTEELGQSTLQLGSEAQNYRDTGYGGQQTEDLGQSTLHLGQETQNIGQQNNDKYIGGQQTYAGQQTGRTGQESFYIGRDRQTQNTATSFNSQTTYNQQHTQNSQDRSHSHSTNKDEVEMNHLLEIQQSLQSNKPGSAQSGIHIGESNSQSNLRSANHNRGTVLANGRRGDQREEQSFLDTYPREDTRQQTVSVAEVEPEVEITNMKLNNTNNDKFNQNLHFAHEDYDLGQQTVQVDDWPQNGELQVAQRQTVSINNNLDRAEISRNKVVEKQEVAPVTTTENPGFWKNVGSKAKSWFG